MSDVGMSDILAQFVASLGTAYCLGLRMRQKVFFHYLTPFIDPTC